MTGWIKLHRKILDSSLFDNPDLLKVWVWCLLKAAHKDYKQMVGMQKIDVKKGQFIFGRKKASRELNMAENKTYRLMKRLEELENLNIKSYNKYSLVTIEKWELYQDEDTEKEQQIDNKQTANQQQVDSNQTTSRQQIDTNKNVKKDKNIKKSTVKSIPQINYQEIADAFNATCISLSKVRSLSDARKKAIRARLNNYKVDDFIKLFEMAEESDFLKGSNNRNWTANFDWLIKDANMAKVLDGNYKNSETKVGENTSNKFNQFNQRQYTEEDYSELERKLLNG